MFCAKTLPRALAISAPAQADGLGVRIIYAAFIAAFSCQVLAGFPPGIPTQVGAAFDSFGPHVVDSAVATNPDRTARITIGIQATENSSVVVSEDASVISTSMAAASTVGFFVSNNASIVVRPSTRSDQVAVNKYSVGLAIGMLGEDRGLLDFRGRINVTGQSVGTLSVADFGDDSTLIFSGVGVGQFNGNGNSDGIRLTGSAKAVATGSIAIINDANGGSTGVSTSDSSAALVSGRIEVADQGNGDAIGILAREESLVDFRGEAVLNEAGNGVTVFADVGGRSHTIVSGSMRAETAGNGHSPGLRVHGNASLDFVGGQLSLDSTFRGPGPMIDLSEAARMTWKGGELDLQFRGSEVTPLMALTDTSSITIFGSVFNRPLGVVGDLAGSLSGILSDGSHFSVDFTRGEAATIRLVPEAEAHLMLLIGCCVALGASRRSVGGYGS